MTEADYVATGTRPVELFRFAAARSPVRRVRLLNAACCRLFADDLSAPLTHALTVLEDHARGLTDDEQFNAAAELVWDQERRLADRPDGEGWRFPAAVRAVAAGFHPDIRNGADHIARALADRTGARRRTGHGQYTNNPRHPGERRTVARAACDAVRCVAGNPFRPWQLVPDWLGGGVIQPDGERVRLTETARTLASVIDAGRLYERLPILADALEEAGITDTELLTHCRADTTHHPGCWAVELGLGRS